MDYKRPSLTEFQSFAERDSFRQSGFDHTVAKYLLQFYKLQRFTREVEETSAANTGEKKLSVQAFLDRFPDFPLWLFTHRLPFIHHDLRLDRLLKAIQQRRIVEKYEELVDDQLPDFGDDTLAGLIFAYPPVGRGMVLHNDPAVVTECVTYAKNKPCVRFVWPLSGKRARKFGPALVMEPLQQLLAYHSSWEPQGV